jgi:hypothetical protein
MNLRANDSVLAPLADYWRAVTADSGGRWTGFAHSTLRVLLARFRYGVGPRFYSMYDLRHQDRGQWGQFITDDRDFQALLLKSSPAFDRAKARDKVVFYEHCLAHGIPTIPILGVVVGEPGDVYDGVPQISTLAQFEGLLDGPGPWFVKPVAGSFGKGAFVVSRQGDAFAYLGRTGKAAKLFDYLQSGVVAERAWVVQPQARNHAEMRSRFSPHSLGTVRLVTSYDGVEARPVAACLKVPVGRNAADNFHLGRSGNLLAAVDLATGRLSAARGSARRDWPVMQWVRLHPDSGREIEGAVLPHWQQAVETAVRAHCTLPALRSAGWDLAITDDGVLVVECNNTYHTDILQIAHFRGMRKLLVEAASPAGARHR